MAGRAELTVDFGRGQLGQHVLIQIALAVPLRQIQLVYSLNDFRQFVRCGNLEGRILHKTGIRCLIIRMQILDKRKNFLLHKLKLHSWR